MLRRGDHSGILYSLHSEVAGNTVEVEVRRPPLPVAPSERRSSEGSTTAVRAQARVSNCLLLQVERDSDARNRSKSNFDTLALELLSHVKGSSVDEVAVPRCRGRNARWPNGDEVNRSRTGRTVLEADRAEAESLDGAGVAAEGKEGKVRVE